MEVFVARQPIFDVHKKVFAYELLYRRSTQNSFSNTDGDEASSNVIINSFLVIGLEQLTGGKKAFVNFTENLLKQGVATILPNDKLVVEVLETVRPEEDIVGKCRELKRLGYTIALDDFVFSPEYEALIDLADIIKVDFIATEKSEQKNLIKRLNRKNIRFLAEKIETHEEFQRAREWGYSYFQGYFFSKPVILSTTDIPPMKFNYLELINVVNQRELDFQALSEVVARDLSLSVKLLQLVNSAAFGFRKRIESVKQALVILGSNEIRKWVSLIALKGIGEDKPYEVVSNSLLRAKFAENLVKGTEFKVHTDEVFLMGLFSMLDVLMNRPMEEILKQLAVSENIKNVLSHRQGPYAPLLSLILAYENAEWNNITDFSARVGLEGKRVIQAYIEAAAWCDAILKE